MKDLNKFFNPKSIAIIGASEKEGSVGRTVVKNLEYFSGNKFYVNPGHDKIFNKKAYKSIIEIKDVDLAIVVTPAKAVLSVIHEISKTNCKNILMITAGFDEIGNSNLSLEIKKILDKNRINLIGPNCLGILNLENNLDATFNSREKIDLPKPGNVSIISQSGALGVALLDLSSYENLNINKFISYGNALDVDESDLLEFLGQDKKTDVILCYIEGIKDGNKFLRVLKNITKTKKVIILKGGVSQKGTTAVKSHTAAIAGSSEVFFSAIDQFGAYSVDSIKDLFNLAKVFSKYKNQEIKNIQIITNGGGFGVLTTDQLDLNNISLSSLGVETIKKIKKIVPEYAVIRNPIDLTGDADNKRFINTIKFCLEDKSVSAIALLILFQLPAIDESIITDLKKLNSKKPIFVLAIGGKKTKDIIYKIEQNGFVCFSDPKELARTLSIIP
jgi:acetate---CoA ligase (ADP-forming)